MTGDQIPDLEQHPLEISPYHRRGQQEYEDALDLDDLEVEMRTIDGVARRYTLHETALQRLNAISMDQLNEINAEPVEGYKMWVSTIVHIEKVTVDMKRFREEVDVQSVLTPGFVDYEDVFITRQLRDQEDACQFYPEEEDGLNDMLDMTWRLFRLAVGHAGLSEERVDQDKSKEGS